MMAIQTCFYANICKQNEQPFYLCFKCCLHNNDDNNNNILKWSLLWCAHHVYGFLKMKLLLKQPVTVNRLNIWPQSQCINLYQTHFFLSLSRRVRLPTFNGCWLLNVCSVFKYIKCNCLEYWIEFDTQLNWNSPLMWNPVRIGWPNQYLYLA